MLQQQLILIILKNVNYLLSLLWLLPIIIIVHIKLVYGRAQVYGAVGVNNTLETLKS